MVVAIYLDATPTRWKHQLETESMRTVAIEECFVGKGVAGQSTLCLIYIIEAGETKSFLLSKILCRTIAIDVSHRWNCRVPPETVATDHLKLVRERFDIVSEEMVITRACHESDAGLDQLYSHGHSSDLLNHSKCPICVHEIEGRCPVSRQITIHAAAGASPSAKTSWSSIEAKICKWLRKSSI